MPMPLKPCPSLGARDRHIKAGEDVCDECQAFWLEYLRKRRKNPEAFKRGVCAQCGGGLNVSKGFKLCSKCRKKPTPYPCGTTNGYIYHTRMLKEKPCDACREARNQARREARALKKKVGRRCINPGCPKILKVGDNPYCWDCRQQPIIGWMNYRGVQHPIYNVRGRHARKAG